MDERPKLNFPVEFDALRKDRHLALTANGLVLGIARNVARRAGR